MKQTNYKVNLAIGDIVFKSENEDLLEAIKSLNVVYNRDITNKGIFTITKGKKKVEKLMYVFLLRRFFANDLAKIVWVKMWKSILDNE